MLAIRYSSNGAHQQQPWQIWEHGRILCFERTHEEAEATVATEQARRLALALNPSRSWEGANGART